MLDFTESCRTIVPNVVMSIVGAPVTSPENEAKCRIIAESRGAVLRVRPYENPVAG
jgi:hypothetical protein